MRKKCIAGISIFLILILLLFIKKLEETKFTVFNQVSHDKAEEIWNNRTRVERFDFRSLMCNGICVAVDYIEKTFYIPLDMEVDEWEDLEFTSGDSEYQLLFWEDFTKYDKKELIADGTVIEFLVYTEEEFAPYYIIFTGLPVIDISTADGIENRKEISGSAVFYDTNFSTYGVLTSAYNGHVRGNTSTLYPKKGYKLNLIKQESNGAAVNNKLSLFGMRKDDDWILYALYNDSSKMRVKLSNDLWNEMGAKEVDANANYNSNVSYVELLVDESYYGLYALMEPIDAKQLNLQAEDYAYKREEPEDFFAEAFRKAKNLEEHVLGFELKEGILDENAWQPMAELSEVITASDEQFIKSIGEIVDEENTIRLWLYIQVITGYDQRGKNVFYIAKKENEGYRFYFAPWDLDLTWGNIAADVEPFYTIYQDERVFSDYIWEPGDRLVKLNVNDAADKMQSLYTDFRKTMISSSELETRILELNHTVRDSGAYERDQKRWPEGAYAEDCSEILNYAKRRMEYLDTALFDLENYEN